MKIIGYIGSKVNLRDLFTWEIEDEELSNIPDLHLGVFTISKKKEYKKWKKIIITVEYEKKGKNKIR